MAKIFLGRVGEEDEDVGPLRRKPSAPPNNLLAGMLRPLIEPVKAGAGASPPSKKRSVVEASPGFIRIRETSTTLIAQLDVGTNEIGVLLNDTFIASARWARSRIENKAQLGRIQIPDSSWLEFEVSIARAIADPEILRASEAHPLMVVKAGGGGLRDRKGIEQELGDANEHTAVQETRKACSPFEWVNGVRRATLDEDRRGIDIVITTANVGEIYVQVKSSQGGANSWIRKYSTSPIFERTILLVMNGGDPGARIGRIRYELERLYRRLGGSAEPASSPPAPVTPPPSAPLGELADPTLGPLSLPLHPTLAGMLKNVSSSTPGYLVKVAEVQRLALERDKEKRLRMEVAKQSEGYLLLRAYRRLRALGAKVDDLEERAPWLKDAPPQDA